MLHYITLLLCLSFGEILCGTKAGQSSEKPATATKPASGVIKLQRVDGKPTATERESVFYNSDAHTNEAIKAILIRYPDIKTDKNFLVLNDKTEKFDTSKIRASGVFMKLGEDQILVEIKKGDRVTDDEMPGRLISENKSYQLRLLNQKELDTLIRKLPAGLQYIGINEIKPLEKNGYFVHCTSLFKTNVNITPDFTVWSKTQRVLNKRWSIQAKEIVSRDIYLSKDVKAIPGDLYLDENGFCTLTVKSADGKISYEVIITAADFQKCIDLLDMVGQIGAARELTKYKDEGTKKYVLNVRKGAGLNNLAYVWLEIVPESSSAAPQKK